jgi:hypothetical protein
MSIIFVDDDEDEPLDTVFAQRIMPDEDETGHLIDILLPCEGYVVVPFVTCLIRSTLVKISWFIIRSHLSYFFFVTIR